MPGLASPAILPDETGLGGPTLLRHIRRDHHARPLPGPRPLKPFQQDVGITDRCGQPDPLERPAAHVGQPFQDREQVPAPVTGAERMHLVDDHHSHVLE